MDNTVATRRLPFLLFESAFQQKLKTINVSEANQPIFGRR